jgi:hypothetical protein
MLTELVYCVTVAFTNLNFNGDFNFGKTHKSQEAKSGLLGCWQTWVMQFFDPKKACTRVVEWADALMRVRLSARLVTVNAAVTQYTSCHRRLTADWLAPRENDFSSMRSKVSSDWLPSYIKATRPVLEIFKMAGYFPYGPRMPHQENASGVAVQLHALLISALRRESVYLWMIPGI